MKRIVVMTGSFNPVTKAHYAILSDGVTKMEADEGIFVTTNDKYLTKKILLKTKDRSGFILSEAQRGEMLRSLSTENPKLGYWGSELGGADPTTFKTLVRIQKDKQKQYPGEEIKLYFLFGADKLKGFPNWNNAEGIIEMCDILVYARRFDIEPVIRNSPLLTRYRDRIHLLTVADDDLEDVSSTEVRCRFFAGMDYQSLMNDGPYRIMKTLSPAGFHAPTQEEIIEAQLLYGGRYGKGDAQTTVYKLNAELFKSWSEPFLGDRDSHREAKIYKKEFNVDCASLTDATVFGCVNADCVDVAQDLVDEGLHPAILNLASRTVPCGGYHKGASAQEESLCRSSTLSQSLYRFGNPKYKHIREAGVPNVPGVYPLDLNFGGVYSPCVTFFRHTLDRFFALRETPFDCPVVTVASLSNRERNEYSNDERGYFDARGCLTPDGRKIETDKIRTIFRIALDNGRDSMVLGAFGCGVYNLHCDEVAGLFRDVLEEDEFKNRFRKLVFAIYEGKPSARRSYIGKNGKFAPFYELFT